MKNALAIVVAVIGIATEIVAIVLLGRETISIGYATPLIIIGMFLAFVPVFIVARRAKRQR